MFTQVVPDLDDAWFEKFDRLYQNIRNTLGQPAVPLQRLATTLPPQASNTYAETAHSDADTPDNEEATPQPTAMPTPTEGPDLLLTTLALALAAGGAAVVYKLLSKPRRTRSYSRPEDFRHLSADATTKEQSDGLPDFSHLQTSTADPDSRQRRQKKRASPPEQAETTQTSKRGRTSSGSVARARSPQKRTTSDKDTSAPTGKRRRGKRPPDPPTT